MSTSISASNRDQNFDVAFKIIEEGIDNLVEHIFAASAQVSHDIDPLELASGLDMERAIMDHLRRRHHDTNKYTRH